MALVKCPECGKKVSDTAVSCPNCGYGIKEHFERKRKQEEQRREYERALARSRGNNTATASNSNFVYIFAAIIAVLLCVAFMMNSGSDSKSSGNALSGEVRCYWCSKVIYNDGRPIHCSNEFLNTYKCDYCGTKNVIK